MNVLVACEFSGVVRDAFNSRGHHAASCDLLQSESLPVGALRLTKIDIQGNYTLHYKMDVLELLRKQARDFDLLIAHPPCTFLTNAGARWLYDGKLCDGTPRRDHARWDAMREASKFFNVLLAAPIPRICVENPIMHRHARALITTPYAQLIQPWQFGHAETKATCLWLKGLPPLKPTNVIAPDFEKFPRRVQVSRKTGEVKQGRSSGFAARVHFASPGADRWKERSRTLQGIAEAMAEQWGDERK